jgi:fatty acid desaturase
MSGGAGAAACCASSQARPNRRAAELGTTLFGVLLFVALWVVGYAALTGPAWTSWLVGAFTVVVSQTVVRPFNRGPRRAAQN